MSQQLPKLLVDLMMGRFLSWPLPKDFAPDGGISFTPLNNPNCWPIGTNLLTAGQARKMVEHMLAVADPATTPPAATDGFVMVPKEPTQSMVDSGALSVSSRFRGDGGWCGFKEAEEFAVGSYRAMIAAAPQSGKKEDGWLPIDTAPTDGTDVLLWTAPWKTGAEGRYIEDEGWYLANVHPADAYGEQIYPTHWMHLPPAPSTPSKAEDE